MFPLDHARTQETLTGMLGEAVSLERHTQLTPCDPFVFVPHLSSNIRKCSHNPTTHSHCPQTTVPQSPTSWGSSALSRPRRQSSSSRFGLKAWL